MKKILIIIGLVVMFLGIGVRQVEAEYCDIEGNKCCSLAGPHGAYTYGRCWGNTVCNMTTGKCEVRDCWRSGDKCCNLTGTSGAYTYGWCDANTECNMTTGKCEISEWCHDVGDKCCSLVGPHGAYTYGNCSGWQPCNLTTGKCEERDCDSVGDDCCSLAGTSGAYTYGWCLEEIDCNMTTGKCEKQECDSVGDDCCELAGTSGAYTHGWCSGENDCNMTTGKCEVYNKILEKKEEGEDVCLSEGDICCHETVNGQTEYFTKTQVWCKNNLLCDTENNKFTCVKVEINIDNLNKLCPSPRSHGLDIKKQSYVCILEQDFDPPWPHFEGGGGGGVGDAELPDYPDGVGFKFKDATLGTVIGKIIEYIYIFAGFALLVALLMGGFTVLTAAGSPEKAQKGYNQATYGVIGFIIIFVSYMVVLLIQAIFHVKIFF